MLKKRKPFVRLWQASLAAVLLLLGLTAQAQNAITNGLKAYWNFDGNFYDSTKVFHGTARGTNPVAFVDGKTGFGKAIKLDGTDQFVEITGGNPDDLAFAGGSMSIAGWFKVEAFDISWQALVAKGEGSNWRVARNGTNPTLSYAGGLTDALGATDVSDGNWHHFVAISDATGAAFGTALYIDGAQDGIIEGSAALASNGLRVMIGENPGARGRPWDGEIDDVAIWDRVITEAEIATLYASGTGKPLSSFLPAPPSGTVTIVKPPANASAIEGTSAEFSVETSYTGSFPPTYQWRKNGADIPGAAGSSYKTPKLALSDSGSKYSVKATVPGGDATSTEASLTVLPDTVAPVIVSASGSATFDSVTVTFSEPVDPTTAQAAANYKLSGGITISAATLNAAPDDNKVTLSTSKQSEGQSLTLTVSNVKDLFGNIIVANTTLTLLTHKFAAGFATYERWQYTADPGGIDVLAQALLDGTQGLPSVVSVVSQFECPWGVGEYYFARVFGFFIPPSNGNYVFFTDSDDQSNLYLSTDETPANKKLIAQETAWSNQYQFTASGGSSDLTAKRSDQFGSIEWPGGNTITLTAGKKYYMEALLKEGTGGDGVTVTFIKEGDADPSNDAAGMHMTASAIATFVDPNGAGVTITKQPASVTIAQNTTATLTIEATGTSVYGTNVTYQWQRAAKGSTTFTDIAGATSASYTTPLMALADDGSQFQVKASVPTVTVPSSVAVVTINSDVTPPTVISAGALGTRVGVAFSELMDKTSAETPGNYTVSGTTVTAAALNGGTLNGKYVVLTVSAAPQAGFTVNVKNVKDLAGNSIVTTTVNGSVSDLTATDVGEVGVDPIVAGYSSYFGNNTYLLAGSGHDIWDSADGFQYAYKEFTGPLDLQARVEWMSPLSGFSHSSTWAKTEIMVRESTAAGSRHVSICTTRPDGVNAIEGQFRDIADAASTNLRFKDGVPYPNAWLRIVRENATDNIFKLYWSSNGTDWTLGSTHTVPAPALPAKVLVGLAQTSHDNVEEEPLSLGVVQSFSVKPFAAVVDPQLKVTMTAGTPVITWATGTLVASPTVKGTYTPVAGATSPYAVTPSGSAMFFQVQK